MLLHDLRKFVRAVVENVNSLPVLDNNGDPPQSDVKSGRMEGVDNLLDAIHAETSAGQPVSSNVEPAGVERGPFQSQFLQLGDGADHLRGSKFQLVAPAAPVRFIIRRIRFWDFPALRA